MLSSFGYKKVEYWDLGVGVRGKNLESLFDDQFSQAHATAAKLASPNGQPLKKMRWRAHTAVWAAGQALTVEGDFVECGVDMGFLSHTICAYHQDALKGRSFYLFDTFQGLPLEGLTDDERELAEQVNGRANYQDSVATVSERFLRYPEVHLVQGMLPGSLDDVQIDKIGYLSIDLNMASTEMAVIDRLWPKLSTGGVVLLDDYAWAEHAPQKAAWDKFALSVNRPILTLPTGQGLLIK